MRLVPKIRNGYIKFHKTHIVLHNQLKNFPKGKIDGCDALEMCISIAIPELGGAFCFGSVSYGKMGGKMIASQYR
jgi:hypothetical protein